MIKTGIDEIPNLHCLIAAINKKESSSQYLADLQEIRKAYVQDVKENYSTDKIAQPGTGVNPPIDMTKQLDPVMSLSDEGQSHKEYGNWNVYGNDIAYKAADIAPVDEDIAPVWKDIVSLP